MVSKADMPLKALSPVNSPSIATNEASSIADKIEGSAFQKLSDVTSIAPACSRVGEDRNGHNGHKGHQPKGTELVGAVDKSREVMPFVKDASN